MAVSHAREINKNKTLINDRTSPGEIEEILKKFHGTSLSVPGIQFVGTGRWSCTQLVENMLLLYSKVGTTSSSDYHLGW